MLDRAAIASRIPHAGAMCLLDRVVDWDAKTIRCAALSHRAADNPLREDDGLPIWAGIEYAAQAAAVHGALLNPESGPKAGVLAAARDVVPQRDRLDDIAGELLVDADLVHADPAGGIYRFRLHDGDATLLSGQFTLMFSPRHKEP